MKSIRENWNDMAAAYEIFNNSPDSYSYNIEWPCIRDMLPELKGRAVLDLGCGTGIFTFLLEQYGPARLVGIDLSEEMLGIAREKACERRSGAEFILGDAAHAADCVQGMFDLVFSSTTTHYIENLDTFFGSVARCLRPGGSCILSAIHPVYSAMYPIERGDAFPDDDAWVVRYLDRSRRAYIQPWIEYNDAFENELSRSYHHSFGDYVNAIVRAGLSIRRVEEPLPPEEWRETNPERYDSFIETPTFMLMELSKEPAQS
ncbi:MAG: class I SAM-dependent methyltransferase [Aristaeellaceae bacterium]